MMGTMSSIHTPLPTPLAERSLAPDLARGALLLFIAIANAPWYLWTSDSRGLSAWPVEASVADRIIQSISLTAIDGRSYPMFAALFGYGIWQLYSRQRSSGTDQKSARRLLRRRHAWMLAFGLVHAALLWAGDIVGAYGLVGLIIGWLFLDRGDRTLRVWIGVLSAGLLVFVVGLSLLPVPLDEEADAVDLGLGIATADYGESLVERLLTWLVLTPAQALAFVVPIAMLVAILAARHRVLEDPTAHLPLLRRAAIVGIGLGWIGGGVTAAQNANLLGLDASADPLISAVHSVTGLACGLGYVAAFGVIAAGITTTGSFTTALRSLGSRSLTFYLAQSLIFAPLMSAWGFGLGAHLDSWSIALIAVVVWLVSLAVAAQLERRGIRGPAERLLRALAYTALAYRANRSTTAP